MDKTDVLALAERMLQKDGKCAYWVEINVKSDRKAMMICTHIKGHKGPHVLESVQVVVPFR